MKSLDLSNVNEAGTNEGLKAGGYVCKYITVSDVTDKEYLLMELDVAEGPNKDYYKDLNERAGFWGLTCYRSYKEKALPMFKRMCSAVTKSNPGFIFDGGQQNADEKTLVGKIVGIVLREEEYEKNDGSVGSRLVVAYECEADKIRKGDFTVPAKKVLDKATPTDTSFVNTSDSVEDEIPFA